MKISNARRDEIVANIENFQKQQEELRKQLDEIEYEEKFADAKQYEGKCFKEHNEEHNYVVCVFVYDTDKINCEPKSICVRYWKTEDTHFEIEYNQSFYPKKWNEMEMWTEVSKEEFDKHYKEVLQRIEMAVTEKILDN